MSSSASSTAAQPSPHTTPPQSHQPPTTSTSSTTPPTSTTTNNLPPPSPPPPPTPQHTTEARTALVASLSNLLDAELAPRASALHAGSAALERQERELRRATGALAAETARLGAEAEVAGRGVKMLGDVQNWAEVLEREFLMLEETVRILGEGEEGCESGCSCDGSGDERERDGKGEGEGAKGKVDLDDMAKKLGALDFGMGSGTGGTALNGSGNESTNGTENENGDRKADKGKAPVYPPQTQHIPSQASCSDTAPSLGTESPVGTDAVRESGATSLSTTSGLGTSSA